ncbi:MAG: hypothetical protein SO401_05830 [Blautia sp.]|nr:hypothetical protein [Blautia sp.]
MNLTNNKNLTVTFVTSRMDKNCKFANISQTALYERFEPSQIVRSPETMAEYLKMSKSQQDNLKDIGGFIGGTLDGKRRKKSAITGMTIIILDADAVIPYGSKKWKNNSD